VIIKAARAAHEAAMPELTVVLIDVVVPRVVVIIFAHIPYLLPVLVPSLVRRARVPLASRAGSVAPHLTAATCEVGAAVATPCVRTETLSSHSRSGPSTVATVLTVLKLGARMPATIGDCAAPSALVATYADIEE
jgi:hypothetical protein